MIQWIVPRRLEAGDRVAVVSPSWAGPAVFPAPYELGLQRLREVFGLEPVEFPTTRLLNASPEQRADDLHAAFADPDISGVIATIGGNDQLKVLAHLDPGLIAAHPKPFLGYSDNTNLLHFLWRLGIVAYHGGCVMVELGRPGKMHPLTQDSIHRALFTGGPYQVPEVRECTDESGDWRDPTSLTQEPPLAPVGGWVWHGPERRVAGRAWGGCLEIIDYHLRATRYLGPLENFDGAVLFIETSEDLPSSDYVYEVMMGMGERGLLQRFPAVLVARARAWSHRTPNAETAKRIYREDQQQAILQALREYHPEAVALFNVDFGHTDPQVVIPYGGEVTVDSGARTLTLHY